MRSSIFLDSNGWLALLNATEDLHVQAMDRWLDLLRRGRGIVLTDWIIAETGNGLARSRRKNQFAHVVQEMIEVPSVELVLIDRELLVRSLSMYVQHTDKSWGLVDCASFVVMRERGIAEAFTSDQHFEQAGFKRLLPA
jgi:uncharacterized protein